MNDDPYAPPKAPLEVDSVIQAERGSPPDTVKYSVRLLLLSAALLVPFLAAIGLGLVQLPGQSGLTFRDVASNLLTAIVLVLIAKNVSAARNWARWLLAIGVGVGGVFLVYTFLTPDLRRAIPSAVWAFNFVENVLQASAAVFLFLPQSNVWFSNGVGA